MTVSLDTKMTMPPPGPPQAATGPIAIRGKWPEFAEIVAALSHHAQDNAPGLPVQLSIEAGPDPEIAEDTDIPDPSDWLTAPSSEERTPIAPRGPTTDSGILTDPQFAALVAGTFVSPEAPVIDAARKAPAEPASNPVQPTRHLMPAPGVVLASANQFFMTAAAANDQTEPDIAPAPVAANQNPDARSTVPPPPDHASATLAPIPVSFPPAGPPDPARRAVERNTIAQRESFSFASTPTARIAEPQPPKANELRSITVATDRRDTVAPVASQSGAEPLVPEITDEAARATGITNSDQSRQTATLPPADMLIARNITRQMTSALAASEGGTTEIILDPQELGRVRLSLQAVDMTITLTIQAERPETADLMRRHIDQLTQDFRSIGYQNISFSFGQDRNQAQPDSKGHAHQSANPDQTANSTLAAPLPSLPATMGHLDLRL